ncbi:MAG: ATP-dependent helicase, partial [Deltaproteobacteria bacterium]|nr:ATP-dependent helicase [Deltaproteobacteria bacterium]
MADLRELGERLRRARLARLGGSAGADAGADAGTSRVPASGEADAAPHPAGEAATTLVPRSAWPVAAADQARSAAPPSPSPAPFRDVAAPPVDSEQQQAELLRLQATHPRLAEQLARLDPWQLAAVTSPERAVLVRAHVGSGKTTVLVHKLLYLHFVAGVELARIAVLTFTNKAADELKERIRALHGDEPLPARAFWLTGTFHGVARSLLATALPVEQLGFGPDFAVIDEHEREELWERLIAVHRLRIKYRRQLTRRMENLSRGGDGRFGRMKHPDDLARLAGLAEQEKRQRNLMDFDDLLLLSQRLLAHGPAPPLDWVLIDELQDCDARQLALVERLVGPQTGLFAVGDPHQVIYSWRGSHPAIFDELRQRHGCCEHLLPRSYRCSATILAGARALLGERSGQELCGVRGPGARIVVRRHLDAFQEACYLAGRIRELSAQGVPYREMAVLYRTRRQAEPFVTALAREGIPAEEAARRSLAELPALGWVVRLLRACLNPQPETLRAVLVDPSFGLLASGRWEQLAGKLPGAAEGEHGPDGAPVRLADLLDELPQPGPAERHAAEFLRKIEEMRHWLVVGTPRRSGAELFARLDLYRALRPTSSSHGEDVARAARLLDDLARRWLVDGLEPAAGLRLGLSEAVLGASPMLRWEIDPTQDSVKLLTLHAAKGLEFSHVFISGANEGLLPLTGSRTDPAREAEERRLLFVGLTRTRDRVEISWHLQPEGFGVLPEPSTYLRRLPPELLDWQGGLAPAPWAPLPIVLALPPIPAALHRRPAAGQAAARPAAAVEAPPERAAAQGAAAQGAAAQGAAAQGAAAQRAAAQQETTGAATPAWYPGQAVRHARYGCGTVHAVNDGTVRC